MKELSIRHVTAQIYDIIEKDEGMKLVLEKPVIDYLAPHNTPVRIRVSLRQSDRSLKVGQTVRLRAGLFPLPEPALPGGFDFARYFYFQKIGGVGFGLQPIELISEPQEAGFFEYIRQVRHSLTQHIRQTLPGDAGDIAAALMTGERAAISEDIRIAMRDAGLAHMLAISGLHLGLAAGVLFILIRYLLVFIPGLALRYNVKKWAAALALIGSFGYLALAGFPVSAQRAYVMVALVLTAIMLDRMVLPMRSLALAAIIILCIAPESLFSPSFQLSFEATIAILAVFETVWYRKPADLFRRQSLLYKPILYFGTVLITSLIAGLATAPYVAYHFHQITAWHIIANLAASPLLSLWVMPLAVLAMVAMPFGADWAVFWLMKHGIEAIVAIALWVSSLPHAIHYVPSMPDWGIALITIGSSWLCFWQRRWRFLGVPVILAGIASYITLQQPDILISPQAEHVAVRNDNSGYVMLRGSKRGFKSSLWREALGVDEWQAASLLANLHCDHLGCRLGYHGQQVSLMLKPEALATGCMQGGILITSFYHDCRLAKMSIERPAKAVSIMVDRKGELQVREASSFLDRLKGRKGTVSLEQLK